MKHYGDITKLKGNELPLVDIITGGSPCQNLSVAGNREGLNGESSSLFLEQIRIIKEMRDESERRLAIRGADYDRRDIKPRWMVWENVEGAFNSNGGEDFRIVLQETARIVEPNAVIPRLENGHKWTSSGGILADGWSVFWCLHNSEHWGIAQRRKRICLIADFGGQTASEILFEREGLSRCLEEGRELEEETSSTIRGSLAKSDCISFQERAGCRGGGKGILIQSEKVASLRAGYQQMVCYGIDREAFNQGKNAKYRIQIDEEVMPCLRTTSANGVFHNHIVRRVTPIECERLDGFPDNWTEIGEWIDNEGKIHKSSDCYRYKALGNSICLPYWQYVADKMVSIAKAENVQSPEMASLFDGIGGFPLVYSRAGCKPVWASEIEPFPIAVTKFHFGNE